MIANWLHKRHNDKAGVTGVDIYSLPQLLKRVVGRLRLTRLTCIRFVYQSPFSVVLLEQLCAIEGVEKYLQELSNASFRYLELVN